MALTLPGNIRYTLRQFRLSPVFTAAAMLTLALGIGGATAIFTLIDAIMLRSLPVSDPGQLYRIGDGYSCCIQGSPQERWGMFSLRFYERLRKETPEFEELAAFQAGAGFTRMSVRRQGVETAARPLHSEYVTGNYFSTLGVRAFAGRVFTPSDDSAGSPPVAVLSYRVWQTAYGGDPSVLGSTYLVQDQPFTVIGIAPPGFFGETLRGDPPEIWIPVEQSRLINSDTSLADTPFLAWLRVIGRLRPSASVAGMGPRLTADLRQWMRNEAEYPASFMPGVIRTLPKQVINVVPAGSGVEELKEEYGRGLRILMAVCGLVLLIACANVANLLLARGAARRAQTAVRLAVGASRREIVGQALTESVLLAIGGGIAGLIVSAAAAQLLLVLAFQRVRFIPISSTPSFAILGFAFALALATGILFGAAPAWFATRTDPAEALRGAGRGASGHSSFTTKVLVVVQAALSIILVAGAAMLARSLNNLQYQDLGYQVKGRVLVQLQDLPANYAQAKLAALYRSLEDRLSRLPGIQGLGLALYNPLTNNWGELIQVAGHPQRTLGEDSGSSWDRVSAGYLQGLGMQIVRGRNFTPADNETSSPVAIVNQAFVKQFFSSSEDPIDQHFGLDLPENASTFRIVGVVRDAKFASFALRKPALPMFYVPLAQYVDYKNSLKDLERGSHLISGILLVTNQPPGGLERVLTKVLAEVDPNLTIISVRTLQEQVALSFEQERAVAGLAGLFGIVALILAAIGLYGVTAYGVAQRTNEIGIRMAIGANRGKVMRLILRGASQRVLIGLLVGVPLAIGAGRLIAAELYGVSSSDPSALALAAASLAVCAFAAALIPARRAASISPTEALRTE